MKLRSFLYLSFVLVVIATGCKRTTPAELIPIQAFFGKPERSSFKVSPDGTKVAYLGLQDHCKNIFILDIDQPDSSKQLTYQNNMNVHYFFWATADSIVYSNSQSQLDSLRLFVIDIHTEKSSILIPPADHNLKWVTPNYTVNGQLLAQMNIQDSMSFDLYKIALDGSGYQMIEKNNGNISSWFSSTDGNVRMAMSSDSVEEILWYRKDMMSPYQKVVETDFSSSIVPFGPVQGSDSYIYALSNINRDKLAVVKLNLLNGAEEIISEHKRADMNREGYLPSMGSMIFSTTSINKKETNILDNNLKSIFNKISKQFEGYNIEILDMDKQFNLVVFKAYTDVNAGGFHYYSQKKDSIVELAIVNPSLVGKQFAPMKEISYNSSDGQKIKGYLTLPLQDLDEYPVVVLVHDGPARRDLWGFNQEVQFLANRGYAVLQVNFRGSTGFGKEFFVGGFKQWGGKIQADINDGVAWLIHQGIADKNRIAIMGTGFGGYSALYAACFNPTLYKCAISTSGFTNLFTYLKEIPPYYHQYLNLYHQIIGDPSKEYDLFKATSPLFHADKVSMPVLMFQGGRDKYNSIADVNQFVQKVKNKNVPIQYIYKDDEGRRFRKEENIVEYYQAVELFLKEHLK